MVECPGRLQDEWPPQSKTAQAGAASRQRAVGRARLLRSDLSCRYFVGAYRRVGYADCGPGPEASGGRVQLEQKLSLSQFRQASGQPALDNSSSANTAHSAASAPSAPGTAGVPPSTEQPSQVLKNFATPAWVPDQFSNESGPILGSPVPHPRRRASARKIQSSQADLSVSPYRLERRGGRSFEASPTLSPTPHDDRSLSCSIARLTNRR
jgi:hypothetical protein